MCLYFLELSGDQYLITLWWPAYDTWYVMVCTVLEYLLTMCCFLLQMLMNVLIPQPASVAPVSILLVVTPVSVLLILSWIPPALDVLVRDHLQMLFVSEVGQRGCKANCLGIMFQVMEKGWNILSNSHPNAPDLEVVIVQQEYVQSDVACQQCPAARANPLGLFTAVHNLQQAWVKFKFSKKQA